MSTPTSKIFILFKKNKTRIFWVIALILSAYFIYNLKGSIDKPTQGFASYYTASKLLINGERVENFYSDDCFSSKVENYVNGIYEIYFVNPPTTSLILIPLSPFDYKAARTSWIIFNVFLLIFSIWFLIKGFDFTREWLPIVIILFLLFQPLYANIDFAQAYILIFFLFVVSWNAFRSDNQTLLGILIGIMIVLKSAGLVLPILLITQKKWRSIFWMMATIISISLISLPWIGIESWFVFGEKLFQLNSLPMLSVTAYQTIHSFFYHFFVFNQQWNPYPVINLPVLGILLSVVISLVLSGTIIYYSYKQKNSDLSFAVFLIVGVILSPVSLDYHYVVLLLPILIFIKWLRESNKNFIWILLIFFYALIAAWLPFSSDKITTGWLAIFAYPKLYGAVGLLGLFFFQFFSDDLNNSKISL
jgi:hypothetical protein